MIKFNTCRLTDNILDQWVKSEANVLLIGEKGVGKSFRIIETFKRNNLNYAYFSGATLDPWIHLLGIPKAKLQADGTEKMEFILPENLDNNVEAIFCDEWNRTHKVVRNALLELQQFKSINGRKFPNLKIVWGAVNPPATDDDDANYDVEELDPAQLDRFHVIVELPNEPDYPYFKNKFGDYKGKILVDWWKEQSIESKKILSPRRLDYLGEYFDKGIDIKYLLPISANAAELITKLSLDEHEDFIRRLFDNPIDEKIIAFIKDDKNFLKYKNKFKDESLWKYWKHANKEFVNNELQTNRPFANFGLYQAFKKDAFYLDRLRDINKATPNSEYCNVFKILKAQNIQVENGLNDLIGRKSNFEVLDIVKASGEDVFSVNPKFKDFVHTNIFNSNIFNKLTIADCEELMGHLSTCIYSIKNHLVYIPFMVHVLKTYSQKSITEKNILPLFGTMCLLAKNALSNKDINSLTNIISMTGKKKISSNRINEFLSYLTGKYAGDNFVPEYFTIAASAARKMINNK